MGDLDEGFETGTEITFNCIKGAAGERTTWKIICDDGVWTGRSFDCGEYTFRCELLIFVNVHLIFYLQWIH